MQKDQNNYGNTKEIQAVRKDTTLSVLALLLAFYVMFKPFFGENVDSARHNSINKAKSLAYQLAEIQNRQMVLNQDTSKVGRLPASLGGQTNLEIPQVGTIGQNENGQPYHYQITKSARQSKIIIWSQSDFTDKTEVLIPLENL